MGLVAARLIREARERARISQSELARRAGTAQSAISSYESGVKDPTVDVLARILAAAGADVADLVPSSARPPNRGGRDQLELLRDHRHAILAVSRRHGASGLRVFGSVARGEADESSDIDLLVDFEPGRTLFDQSRLERELEELLGVDIDVISSGALLDRDQEILADAVML